MLVETVTQVSILALLILSVLYFWRRFSAYLKFPCYFWFPFDLIKWLFLPKRPKNATFGSFILQEVIHICKKFQDEGLCIMWLNQPVLLVYGEEIVKFLSKEATLTDKSPEYKFFDVSERFSSVILSNGEKWRKERRMISPAFKLRTIREMAPAMNKHAAGLVEKLYSLRNKTVDDTLEHVKEYSMKLFCESVMSVNLDSGGNNTSKRIRELTDEFFEIIAKRIFNIWLHLDFFWNISPLSKKCTNFYEEMSELAENIYLESKEKITSQMQNTDSFEEVPERNTNNYRTFMDVLMELHVKDPSFTKDDLLGQLFTIVTAGYDSSATSLTWALWLLGLHQDIQEKAYDEILSSTNKYIEFEDTRKLIYLECIIKESLRLYPLVPFYARRSTKDISFGKYKIPKSTTVYFFPYALHRNPKLFPDPEAFNPDRFRNIDCNKCPVAIFPFAEGTRSCIGKEFAMLEIKIFLAHLLRSFRVVSLDCREDIIESWELLLKSSTPLRMKFLPR